MVTNELTNCFSHVESDVHSTHLNDVIELQLKSAVNLAPAAYNSGKEIFCASPKQVR